MKKVLFDTNIILDIALKRNPYFQKALLLFGLINENKIAANITATTITDIYYITKKTTGHELALEFISNLVETVDIIGINKDIIQTALESNIKDFEDAVQISAASFATIDCIITRNKKDFINSQIEIVTPTEFLEKYNF